MVPDNHPVDSEWGIVVTEQVGKHQVTWQGEQSISEELLRSLGGRIARVEGQAQEDSFFRVTNNWQRVAGVGGTESSFIKKRAKGFGWVATNLQKLMLVGQGVPTRGNELGQLHLGSCRRQALVGESSMAGDVRAKKSTEVLRLAKSAT